MTCLGLEMGIFHCVFRELKGISPSIEAGSSNERDSTKAAPTLFQSAWPEDE